MLLIACYNVFDRVVFPIPGKPTGMRKSFLIFEDDVMTCIIYLI